ncbi:hypothetical protein ACNO5E_13360 [Vibrio parahaemolyticus]|uniref:hypothetical protein n=1 Tax=Vibrio parahaemolyticus TaxID=670 RepID=UPI000812F632|nr:hypothetical protein [Vibrio parahaemolyticus]OCP68251.1 hypothetical protein AKH08_15655 [Vibrio parahaemolyticus]
MLKHLPITQSQADDLPETNAIASTPDQTEYYLCVETAKNLELFDTIVAIEPEIKSLTDSGATVIHLHY